MLIEKVENYLTSKDKTLDEAILESMYSSFVWSVRRQFMEVRESKGGLRGSNPGPCARKMAYTYLGYAPTRDFEARTYVTFATGDLIELFVIGLLKLAGVELRGTCLDEGGQLEGLFDAGNGVLVPCHPDGIVLPQIGVTDKEMLLEVKSAADYGFKYEWSRGTYSDNYKLQHQVYLDTFGVDAGIFFIINKNTGHFAEVLTERDPDYLVWARKNYAMAAAADPDSLPPRFIDNENTGRKRDKKGNLTANLAWLCSYCDFSRHCWPGVQVEFEKGKPVYVVPTDIEDPTPEIRFEDIVLGRTESADYKEDSTDYFDDLGV